MKEAPTGPMRTDRTPEPAPAGWLPHITRSHAKEVLLQALSTPEGVDQIAYSPTLSQLAALEAFEDSQEIAPSWAPVALGFEQPERDSAWAKIVDVIRCMAVA